MSLDRKIDGPETLVREAKELLARLDVAEKEFHDWIQDGRRYHLFLTLKFGASLRHPLSETGNHLNPLEFINQAWTALASLMAIDWLIEKPEFRSRHFDLNLGARSGYDILSGDDPNNVIVAEVFASRNPKYNKKLESDVQKVSNYPNAKHRYVFALVPDKQMLEQVRSGVFIQGFDPNDFQQWAKRMKA